MKPVFSFRKDVSVPVFSFRKDVSVTDYIPLMPEPGQPHPIIPLTGAGDMYRAVYDTNNNDIVDAVENVAGLDEIINDLYAQMDQIPPHEFSFGDASQTIYTPGSPGYLTTIRVQMLEAFDGDGASLNIGDDVYNDAIMPDAFIDLYSQFEFENTPDYKMEAGQPVVMSLSPGTATRGKGIIFIKFNTIEE